VLVHLWPVDLRVRRRPLLRRVRLEAVHEVKEPGG
jgi:hypothetical protein